MKQLTNWLTLAKQQTYITGVEYFLTDQAQVLRHFYSFAQVLQLPVYFWNPGCSSVRQLVEQNGKYILQLTELGQQSSDIVQYLLDHPDQSGIFLLEGILRCDPHSNLIDLRLYQLSTAYQQLSWSMGQQYWVLLAEHINLPVSLQPLIPVLTSPLPDRQQIQDVVAQFCETYPLPMSAIAQDRLVRSCQGLPIGEIQLVLHQHAPFAQSIEHLAEQVLSHKTAKLSGRGLEFISEPDVASAGGLDLLDARLDLISTLFNPDAQQIYGLKFPRGMVLWGPPGTGKSLSAKLTAKKMGVPLLAVDWASVRSDQDLRFLLQTAEAMSPCVLYFDDFDKGFAGWDSNADGGLSRRRAGKLLTWMQEHQSQVFIVATVNRLGMMPPELIRRFEEEIYFVDLPNEGARYDIFNLHLATYFPAFQEAQRTGVSPWSDRQWRRLLVEYRLCTPAEIGNAVRRVAQEAYYRLTQEERVGEPLAVTFDEMLNQRWQFTPAMEREEGAMLEIRNKATFAKPASGEDRSKFARPYQELFEQSS